MRITISAISFDESLFCRQQRFAMQYCVKSCNLKFKLEGAGQSAYLPQVK